jgi:hypothetical protein
VANPRPRMCLPGDKWGLGARPHFGSGGGIRTPRSLAYEASEDDLTPPLRIMVDPVGFEPTTSRLSGVRSNHLSYGSMLGPPLGIEPRCPAPQAGALPLSYGRHWYPRPESNRKPSN